MGQKCWLKNGNTRKVGLSFKCYRVFPVNADTVKQGQLSLSKVSFLCLIMPYNWHFLELHDTVLYFQFCCTYLIINSISRYNIISPKNKKCQSFVVMLGHHHNKRLVVLILSQLQLLDYGFDLLVTSFELNQQFNLSLF